VTRLHGKWIVFYAIAVHLLWGVVGLISGEIPKTAPTYGVASGLAEHLGGLFYIIVGLMAIAAAYVKGFLNSLALVLPQQVVLLSSGFGSLICVIRGRYADGYSASPEFILVDQAANILVGVFHTLALLEVYAWPLAKRRRS
jgi:hypothetical protein